MNFTRSAVRLLALLAAFLPLHAQSSGPVDIDDRARMRAMAPEQAVTTIFAAYSAGYPDIDFVHLRDQRDIDKLDSLVNVLGEDAQNVDYEHPPEARKDLLEVQVHRILIMLNERLPSSTLFKRGIDSSIDKPYVCVITLDPDLFTEDPSAATRFFFEDLESGPNIHIDNRDFLSFALHHEVFHCLDAYMNGPTRPQTDSEVTASYYNFRAEQRAELYAALMHRAGTNNTSMLKDLASIRTMSLVHWDLQHYTAQAIKDAMTMERVSVLDTTLRTRAKFAMDLADKAVMTPSQYRNFATAAIEVSMLQGEGEGLFSPLHRELISEEQPVDKELVNRLVNEVRITELYFASTRLSKK